MDLEKTILVGGAIGGVVVGAVAAYVGHNIENNYVENAGYAITIASLIIPIIATRRDDDVEENRE